MRAVDIVKAASKTELEAFERWQNNWQSQMISNSRYSKKILIEDDPADLETDEAASYADLRDSIEEDRYQQDC